MKTYRLNQSNFSNLIILKIESRERITVISNARYQATRLEAANILRYSRKHGFARIIS
jgi:hypothetical protein